MEPGNVVWIIGQIIGIELIVSGVTFLMLSFRVKGLPTEADQGQPAQQFPPNNF